MAMMDRCNNCNWPYDCPCEDAFWEDPVWGEDYYDYDRDRDYGDEDDTVEGDTEDCRDDATGKY